MTRSAHLRPKGVIWPVLLGVPLLRSIWIYLDLFGFWIYLDQWESEEDFGSIARLCVQSDHDDVRMTLSQVHSSHHAGVPRY